MAVEILLAVSVTLLAICVIVLLARNNALWTQRNQFRKLWDDCRRDCEDWERRHYQDYSDLEQAANKIGLLESELDTSTEGEALAPRSHNVEDIDTEAIMSDSDDPVWDLVLECRREGVLGEWLLKVRPDMVNAQPHRMYAEFGTWILDQPGGDAQTVASVRARLAQLGVPA